MLKKILTGITVAGIAVLSVIGVSEVAIGALVPIGIGIAAAATAVMALIKKEE